MINFCLQQNKLSLGIFGWEFARLTSAGGGSGGGDVRRGTVRPLGQWAHWFTPLTICLPGNGLTSNQDCESFSPNTFFRKC